MNREQWLTTLTDRLRPHFKACEHELPETLRVSVGFASKTPWKTLGQCWVREAAPDQVSQIYISPKMVEPVQVGGVLMHELLHAALPSGAGHKAPFKRGMAKIGLTGKATSTEITEATHDMLSQMVAAIGDYPHVELIPLLVEKKQTTRMIKLICAANDRHEDDYLLRASRKTIALGLPTCFCGREFPAPDLEDEDPPEPA